MQYRSDAIAKCIALTIWMLICLQYKAPRLTGSGRGQQQKITFQQQAQPTSGTVNAIQASAEELLAAAKLQNEELAKRVKVTQPETGSPCRLADI